MAQRYYYFLTSLPPLPELGEPAPIGLADLAERARHEEGLGPVLDAVLLEHDLLARQGALAGQEELPEPVVLQADQLRGEAPLPEALQPPETQSERAIAADAVWERWFRHVQEVADSHDSEFLREWVGFEVALRNALVAARAKVLEVVPEDYFVAPELANASAPVERIVADWAAAGDPLQAQRALDEGRWAWLTEHSAWYSFSIDEAAAYARRLLLVERWHRLTQEINASHRPA